MLAGGFDQEKLGLVARAVWARGGLDTLVAVLAIHDRPDPGRSTGRCTTVRFLLGLTSAGMEALLGTRLSPGLGGGATLFRVSPLPEVGRFELTGYGRASGRDMAAEAGPSHPIYPPGFGAPLWDVSVSQSRLVRIASVPGGVPFRFEPRLLSGTGEAANLPPNIDGPQPCPPARPRASRTRSSTRRRPSSSRDPGAST